jgi:hypothetical protein
MHMFCSQRLAPGIVVVFGCLTALGNCEKHAAPPAKPASDATSAFPPLGPSLVPGPGSKAKGLKVSGVRLFGNGGRRWDSMFSRGERVFIRFILRGLHAPKRHVHLRTALVVRGPDGTVFLQRPESSAIDRVVPAGKSTRLMEAAVQLDLSRASPPGAYEATLKLRDVPGNGRAEVKVRFQVVGDTKPQPPGLTLRGFHAPPDLDLLAGLGLHIAFEPAGFATRVKPGVTPGWKVHLTAKAVVRDGSGIEVGSHIITLLEQTLPFRATSLPVAWTIPLPATLKQGSYHLKITVTDHLSGKTAGLVHRFTLAPGGLGIYSLRAVGAGGVDRRRFLRGERLTVHMHLRGWAQPTDLGVDVGVVGPDRGFYLVRKNAHRLKDPKAPGETGRKLEIPITIPEFAPGGRWTLKLRLRDFARKRHASRTLTFVVTGKPLRPLPGLQVSQLVLRRWAAGPPVPGLFWRAGQTLYFEAVVGGMRLQKEQGYYHRTRLTCTLRLRDRAGKLQATLHKACQVNRRFSFVPLRLRLRTKWRIPLHLAGKYTFQFEVTDELSDRVSVLQRGCFILIPRGGP